MSGTANENALAGVDYQKMIGFKERMVAIAKRTRYLAEDKGVYIVPLTNAHAVAYEYRGRVSHMWVATKEGLGNKAWIAMLLNHLGHKDPTGQFFMGGIGIDTFLMGANDNAAHGGRPAVLMDEVSCGLDDFFGSEEAAALAASFELACITARCPMGQGESPAYKYLMAAAPPVKFAPSLSVCVVGIVSPREHLVTGERVRPGDIIIGFPSSGLHANGISPTIRWVTKQPDGFLTKLNGRTVGEEALIPTRSYVGLVEALFNRGIDVHAFLPITGDGIGKLASDPRYHYKVHSWLPDNMIPPLFRYMREIGMPKKGILETYNNGIGWVAIVPPDEVADVMDIGDSTKIDGEAANYDPMVIGVVEAGEAGTWFDPWKILLPPPGKE